jgi:ligand-binding SRPBCC domain-containing protein
METIRFSTWIDAPVERCFLLSLNVALHVASARSTNAKVIAGVREGLIRQGETVTFQGGHLGLRWRYTSLIDILRPYSYFHDVMTEGPFERFEHEHHFATMDDGTRIRDEIRFSLGGGTLRRLTTKMFVRKDLTEFVFRRNAEIKRVAESEEWRRYLEDWPRGRAADAATARRWNRDGFLRGSHGIVAPRGNR